MFLILNVVLEQQSDYGYSWPVNGDDEGGRVRVVLVQLDLNRLPDPLGGGEAEAAGAKERAGGQVGTQYSL